MLKPGVICLIFFFISHTSVNAYNDYQLTDLLGGKAIRYHSVYLELHDTKINFYDGLDISYPVLTDLKDTIIQKRLNSRMKWILMSQVGTDSFRLNMLKDLRETTHTYLETVGQSEDRYYLYEDNEENILPQIKSIDFRFLSYFRDIVAFEAVFTYESSYQSHALDETFNYRQLYYFDVRTGKEYSPREVFSISGIGNLAKKIEDIVNKQVLLYPTTKGNYEEDFYDEIEDPRTPKVKKLAELSVINDGFAYPGAFSMIYYIPAWQSCMKALSGMDAEIRLSFDEIRPFINPKGPYGELINFHLPDTTDLYYKNSPTPAGRYTTLRVTDPMAFTPEEIPYKVNDKIKRILIMRQENDKRADTIKKYIFKQADYAKDGQLVEIKRFNSGVEESSTLFSFNSYGQLTKKSIFEDGKMVNAEDYSYDRHHNLILMSYTDDEDGQNKITGFYYGPGFSISESYSFFENDQLIGFTYSRYSQYGSLISELSTGNYRAENSERVYNFTKQNRILFNNKKGEHPSKGRQYIYDAQGKLIADEGEEGDFNQYSYDTSGHLLSESRFNRFNRQYTKKITYYSSGLPSGIEISHGEDSSPAIYIYTYEFW